MGMAASQARLLTITARMHDIEFQAQSIQNAKVQLATQSDAVYQEYLEALDATTLTIKNMDGERITANFNNLFGKNAVDTGNKYALKDQYGRLIVSQDIFEIYQDFLKNSDMSIYELALLSSAPDGGQSIEEGVSIEEIENEVYEKHKDDKALDASRNEMDKIFKDPKNYEDVSNFGETNDPNDLNEEACNEYYRQEDAFKNKLYQLYGDEIFELLYKDNGGEITAEDFDYQEFIYYLDTFKQIELSGGCVSIEDFNGPAGDASTDSEWLQKQIKCGKFVIDIVNKDRKTGEISFASTAVSSDTYLEYSKTSSIDKTALAKAEAKYEHDTKEIDQKDKKFDMDLSKLETEREALKKQYESVKKVVSDNIERTFGLFS